MSYKGLMRVVELFIVILLLIGIFWLAFGSYLFADGRDFTESSEFSGVTAGYIIAISFGAFLVFWSILGLIAACKKINWMIYMYNIGIFFILLASIAILIISIAISAKLPDYKDDKNCTESTFLKDMKELNYKGVKILCSSSCECQFEGSPKEALTLGISNYKEHSGKIRVQDCDYYQKNDYFKDLRGYSGLLRSFEEAFECSGFCSVNSYYAFSDVNKGKPEKDCKDEMLDYFDSNIHKFLIASAILSFILLISFILTCVLCCKKPKGQNFYERGADASYYGAKQQY